LYQTAVIDNSSLIYLSHLHKSKPFFHYLNSLFHTIYFPSEVVKEYARGSAKEPHRGWILERLNPEQGFYRLCSTYDSFIMIIVENYKGIDKGEAETYAQLKKVNAHLIISDDKPFIKALKELDSGIKVYSTLHLICWLHVIGLLSDWENIVRNLYKLRPFKSAELREAYTTIIEKFSLSITKKEISKRCRLSKIV
jgi:predicted nucleic acid-binding protein